jgi:hypothetical protein
MSYQQSVKVRLSWDEKLERFAMIGPFTTAWDDYRAFTKVDGGYSVYYPRLGNAPHPLTGEKPRCAACDSAKPLFFRYLRDRQGLMHLVGQECYSRLCEMKLVVHNDFVSPIPHSEDKAG